MIYKKVAISALPDYPYDEKNTDYPYFKGYNKRQEDIAWIDDEYSFFSDNEIDEFEDFLASQSEKEIRDIAEFLIEVLGVFPDKWWQEMAKKRYSYCNQIREIEIFVMNVCCFHHIIFSKITEKMRLKPPQRQLSLQY
jgi:hypothetical protein